MGKHQKGGLEQAVYQLIRPLIHLIWDDYQLCVVAFFRTIKSLSINAAHNSLYSLSIFPANVHRSCLYGLWALPSSTQNLEKHLCFGWDLGNPGVLIWLAVSLKNKTMPIASLSRVWLCLLWAGRRSPVSPPSVCLVLGLSSVGLWASLQPDDR